MEPKSPEEPKPTEEKDVAAMTDEALQSMATFFADEQHAPSKLQKPETESVDPTAADTPLDPIADALTVDPFEEPQKEKTQ
jgi:hypothetical protein